VWPIVEMPVPQSKVPGELSSPTQPVPSKPAPFERQGFTADNLIDFTPELSKQALAIASKYRLGSLYSPPSVLGADGFQGTLALPGYGGGANWPGAALDAEEGILYIPSATVPIVMAVDRPQDTSRSNLNYVRIGPIYPEGPDGLPLVKPPWGRITAIDLNTGEHLWMLRAYDKKTGDVIAEHKLPGGTTGVPMTYMLNGKQYICVAIGAEDLPAELIALSLP
jgi:quinoprotein glucose dehydrogenase